MINLGINSVLFSGLAVFVGLGGLLLFPRSYLSAMGLGGSLVVLFAVAFSIVGHDFNRYWGLLVSPLWCFGVVRFPASLMDLWKAAGGKEQVEMGTAPGVEQNGDWLRAS